MKQDGPGFFSKATLFAGMLKINKICRNVEPFVEKHSNGSSSTLLYTSGLYYKRFKIIIYDCRGSLQFAAYLMIVIYTPSS
jgi:hypothetical protein